MSVTVKPLAAILLLLVCASTTTTTTTTTALSLQQPTQPRSPPEATCRASRRSFLAIAGAGAASPSLGISLMTNAHSVNYANAAAIPSVYEGMSAFASNKVEESVEIYDSIIRDDPRRKPFLWQRGLSLYYAGRYTDGAEQFATDVAVNPNDTEEQIWHLLCLAKTEGVGSLDEARAQKLTVGKDRRPVMRLVQKLFLGESGTSVSSETEKELIVMAENSIASNAGNRFYASLYLSLYYESLNDETLSKRWMITAIGTEYAKSVGRRDPMVDVAKVAMQRRGW